MCGLLRAHVCAVFVHVIDVLMWCSGVCTCYGCLDVYGMHLFMCD